MTRLYDAAFYVPWVGPLLRPKGSAATGGAETQIFLVTRALSRLGARVCLIAFDTPGGLPEHVDGVDVVARRPYLGHEPGLGKAREVLSTWQVLRRAPARVLVTRAAGPYVPLVGSFARLARRRFVYSSASDADFTPEATDRYRGLYALGIRCADTLVVQSRHQLELARAFSRQSVMIPSITEAAPVASAPAAAFLWIGRMVDYKEPLEFVELARRLPAARFWMVGVPVPAGQAGAQLVDRVTREAAAVPNLSVLAPRPRPQLMELVEQAVAVVNTTRAGFEGMPNTFLEGWTRGVPALSLSHDPDGVVERHRLGGFAGGSRDRLAALATELWGMRRDRHDVSRRCRAYIEAHHAPDVVARQWMRVLGVPERTTELDASPLG